MKNLNEITKEELQKVAILNNVTIETVESIIENQLMFDTKKNTEISLMLTDLLKEEIKEVAQIEIEKQNYFDSKTGKGVNQIEQLDLIAFKVKGGIKIPKGIKSKVKWTKINNTSVILIEKTDLMQQKNLLEYYNQ